MNISNAYNRFLHGVILKQAYDQARSISFREWRDNRTGGCLIFYKHDEYDCMDELKQIFKLMNLNYPLETDEKISTSDITSKELHDHIEWIIKILGENGIELEFIREQWDRLLEQAGIEKEK